ncbi:DUF362 domain-containing protein [Desulfotruncus alcoholivorax]|uniref:DUF362 domain-containing protein n=1 Tax=Desulfotruncus alcoholivorax TaxID=265477 RepID=UPI00040AC68E|nr:DUF362 domain-containing protein [Desulfotruncus alcoholivorax]
MTAPVVSIVKHTDAYTSVKQAIELCDGLKEFNQRDSILIKPNIVAWDFELPFPPYGVITTTAVIFALVRILHEEGFGNIAVGEATLGVSGSIAKKIFKELGYEKLAEEFGVELVDFNEDGFDKVDVGGFEFAIAKRALQADKIINVPVLKTHNQCQVSLGIKNLKGCLSRKSKMQCHGKELDLEHAFPLIGEKLPIALTVIDGIYALAKGPGATGKAYRKDLLVASRDMLACDVVGAALMGYNASDVEYLKFFAGRSGRSVVGLSDIELRGERLEDHAEKYEYDWPWAEDDSGPAGFKKRGITGIAIRKYDSSLCTSCSKLYNPLLILLSSAFKGEPFPGIEVLSGKRQSASPGFEKTLLFGKCACLQNKDNPNIRQAIAVKGCPPDLGQLQKLLAEQGIHCDYDQYINYRRYIFNRYKKEDGFDMDMFIM